MVTSGGGSDTRSCIAKLKGEIMATATYQHAGNGTRATVDPTYDMAPATGWTGWIGFAGVMMVIGGLLNALYGLIAVVNDEWVAWTNRTAVLLDISQWGWLHIVLGLAVLLAGFGVFTGNVLARTVGVLVASVGLIANFLFIPAYPLWAITLVVINMLVIWALIVHGREMRAR